MKNHKIYGLPHKQPSNIGRVGKLKSTVLRKCLNPYCEFYFYGYAGDKYCSKKCKTKVSNLKNKDYIEQWKKEHKENVRKSMRKYVLKNKEKINAYHREWKRNHFKGVSF